MASQPKDLIIAGLVGGIVSAIFYPLFTFIFKMTWTRWRIAIEVDNEEYHKSLRIINNSFLSLKNVIVYVTIDNDKNDIFYKEGFRFFCTGQVVEDRLSWSKNIDGKNQSEININQGESQKLNFLNVQNDYVEVASEQGFFIGRVVLKK